jgi:hypothetical protein
MRHMKVRLEWKKNCLLNDSFNSLYNIQGVKKIMETPGNWGTESVLVTLKELQFVLCSVSALVIVLSKSPCERIGKWEDKLLVCVWMEHLWQKETHIINCIQNDSF